MRYNRFLPLLTPLFSLLLSEIFFYWPHLIYVVVCLAILIFFFTITQFIKAAKIKEKWWNYILLPCYFFIGISAFSVLLPNPFFIQVLFIFECVFLYLYFRSIYICLFHTGQDKTMTLGNLSSYGNFLSFYFISSAMFGLQAFLDISVWSLMVLLLFVIAGLAYQIIWSNNLVNRLSLFYVLIACLVLIELAWSISFLPLSFYILGLVLSVYYYILMGILRHYLLKELNKKTIKRYLFYGLLSALAVLITSRWL